MIFLQNYDISLIIACYDNCPSEWSWNSENNHWTGFHLWYITQNSVTVKCDNETFLLEPGDVFLFDLRKNHICRHDPINPVSMYTAYFHCVQTDLLQKQINEGVILKKQHPIDTAMNFTMFHHLCNSRALTEQEIWFAPILQQIICNTSSQNKIVHLVDKICTYLQQNLSEPFTLEKICLQVGYSKNQLIRLFHKVTGVTPYQYYLDLRLERAKQYLLYSNLSFQEIADNLCFHDTSHFVAQFHKKTGYTPKQFVLSQSK